MNYKTKIALFFIFGNIFLNNLSQGFILFTSLYNETNLDRICEYIICLEANLKNKMIKKIHILYDKSKDDDKCLLHAYLKQKKVIINYISKRPTYEEIFNLSNSIYPKSRIIISNADIYFDESLNLLSNYSLKNKFMGLTRWDVKKGGATKLYRNLSQDSWIYKTPIKNFKSDFELGVLGCENALIEQVLKNKFKAENPCFSIITYHLHLSGIRNYDKQFYIKTGPEYIPLNHSSLGQRKLERINTSKLKWLAYEYAKSKNLKMLANLMLDVINSID
ncbi:MAG: hypothetical protein P4L22_02500 [Candidatus Babeliales bacterium]|nr:hypothetical protein [Candidatus Babeliales bacterium]